MRKLGLIFTLITIVLCVVTFELGYIQGYRGGKDFFNITNNELPEGEIEETPEGIVSTDLVLSSTEFVKNDEYTDQYSIEGNEMQMATVTMTNNSASEITILAFDFTALVGPDIYFPQEPFDDTAVLNEGYVLKGGETVEFPLLVDVPAESKITSLEYSNFMLDQPISFTFE